MLAFISWARRAHLQRFFQAFRPFIGAASICFSPDYYCLLFFDAYFNCSAFVFSPCLIYFTNILFTACCARALDGGRAAEFLSFYAALSSYASRHTYHSHPAPVPALLWRCYLRRGYLSLLLSVTIRKSFDDWSASAMRFVIGCCIIERQERQYNIIIRRAAEPGAALPNTICFSPLRSPKMKKSFSRYSLYHSHRDNWLWKVDITGIWYYLIEYEMILSE